MVKKMEWEGSGFRMFRIEGLGEEENRHYCRSSFGE